MIEYTTTHRITEDSSPGDWIRYYENEIYEGRMSESEVQTTMPALMVRGLRRAMTEGHGMAQVVWDQLVDEVPSSEPYEVYVGVGPITGSREVQEDERFPFGRRNYDRTTIVNKKYGFAMGWTREALMRDKTGEIARTASNMGEEINNAKDKHYVDRYFNSYTGNTIYDGGDLYVSNHPNTTGDAANTDNDNLLSLGALTHPNLETARQTIALWKNFAGEPLAAVVDKLVCAPNQFDLAVRLTASQAHVVTDFSSGVMNTVQGFANPVQWVRLTAGDWYLTTTIPGLKHQVLTQPTVERDAGNSGENFLRQRQQALIFEERGDGITDWRALAKGD